MSYNNLNEDHKRFCSVLEEAQILRRKKLQDYGTSYNSFGSLGVCVQMENKMSRIKRLITMPQSNFESLRDSAVDLLNYSAMLVMELDKTAEKQRVLKENPDTPFSE